MIRLWLQGDNAPKECRNVSMAKWAIALVQGGYFKQVSECFLEVGHTHEDVGRVSLVYTKQKLASLQSSVVVYASKNSLIPVGDPYWPCRCSAVGGAFSFSFLPWSAKPTRYTKDHVSKNISVSKFKLINLLSWCLCSTGPKDCGAQTWQLLWETWDGGDCGKGRHRTLSLYPVDLISWPK